MDMISVDGLLRLVNDPSVLLRPQNMIVASAAVILAIVGLRLVFGAARFIFFMICLVLVSVLSAGATYVFTQLMGNSSSFLQ